MNEKGPEYPDLRTATGRELENVMRQGVRDSLLAHKRAGLPIVVWDREHDRIVEVPPEEIVFPDEADEAMDANGSANVSAARPDPAAAPPASEK